MGHGGHGIPRKTWRGERKREKTRYGTKCRDIVFFLPESRALSRKISRYFAFRTFPCPSVEFRALRVPYPYPIIFVSHFALYRWLTLWGVRRCRAPILR